MSPAIAIAIASASPSPSPPRPILKRSPKSHNHAVHFPPSPSLTRTFFAHSAVAYDRTPIVVAPNTCAMPARGCPGRTYVSADVHERERCKRSPPKLKPAPSVGHHLHPRAVASGSASSDVPPLVPDNSSESEESDGFTSPLPDHALFPVRTPLVRSHTTPLIIPARPDGAFCAFGASPDRTPTASSRVCPSLPTSPSEQRRQERQHEPNRDVAGARPRKRRDRSAARRKSAGYELDEDAEEDDLRAVLPKESYKSFSASSLLASCTLDDNDEGCLGGF